MSLALQQSALMRSGMNLSAIIFNTLRFILSMLKIREHSLIKRSQIVFHIYLQPSLKA